MGSPHVPHIGGSKCESDYRSISSQLVTSKDVQQLTFTYFTEKDAPKGSFCPDCMNQLFRDGKLNEVSMVFVFNSLGFIPFSTRSLVFINGTNVPFSMKDIAEDFLVMPCSNCARNNTKLNTIPVTDNEEIHFSRSSSTSSGRKRKLPDSPSNEKLPAERVKQEIVSPPNLKKRTENFQIVDDQIIDVPPTSVATMDEILARSGNNVVEANVTSSITNNESSVDIAFVIDQTEGSTIVDKSSFGSGQSVDEIFGALMMTSEIDKLPTPHSVSTNNSEETAQNVNKGSTNSCGTWKKVQWSEKVDFFPVNRQAATTDVARWLPHDTAHLPSVLETSKLLVSSTGSSQNKPIENCVPKMSTSARLHSEGRFRQTGLSELDSFVGNKDTGQESSNSYHLAKHNFPSIQPPVDTQDMPLTVAETLKNIYGNPYLSREQLLDPRKVGEPSGSGKNTVVYPHYLIAPFLEGRRREFPRLSFAELYDGMLFLKDCGMHQYHEDFGIFMCQFFPEITEIKFCEYCVMRLHPDPSGRTYINHFFSFDHIINAMNRGRSFSRDFIALRKCLHVFLNRNGYEGYLYRLSGPKLAECVNNQQYSSKIQFPSWASRLKR